MQKFLSLIVALVVVFALQFGYAANTASELYTVNATVHGARTVHYVLVSIDTTGADLTVYTPSATNNACLAGIYFSEGGASANLTIKSGSEEISTLELAANQGALNGLTPPICTEAGSAMKLNSSAVISKMLLQFVEGSRWEFGR